jgi:manganese transport protein
MAGQIVMEGYLNIRLKAWQRRLITRTLAIVPAVLVLVIYGESSVTKLLVFSQVILSLQLPFAVIPLIQFTSNKKMMGEFSISKKMAFLSWITALLIVGLNATLIIGML